MKDIDDITNALAAKYGEGLSIEEKKKPEPVRHERSYTQGRQSSFDDLDDALVSRPAKTGPKIFPSEKMSLKTYKRTGRPNRPPILMNTYSDDDLEWMFSTPVKRGWDFDTWLEVIGLPKDLTEGYDGAIYQYAARAYLNRKKEAHKV